MSIIKLLLASTIHAALDPAYIGTVDNANTNFSASIVREHATEKLSSYPPEMETKVAPLLVSFTDEDRHAALNAGPIDWRAKGAVTKPTSQGRCSTCAYFAGVAAVEGAWQIAGHNLVKLSEQEEIDCYNNGGYAMPNMIQGIARAIVSSFAKVAPGLQFYIDLLVL